jgi:hypothetical protein
MPFRERTQFRPKPPARLADLDARPSPSPPLSVIAQSPGSNYGTVGRRWKFRRNLVIYIASENGCSQRLLADVFDLPHSRIAAIVKEFRSKYQIESE